MQPTTSEITFVNLQVSNCPTDQRVSVTGVYSGKNAD